MPTRPTFTVLMSVYNGGSYLRAAVETILKQTYPHFEFVLINDGSTDGSRDVLRSLAAADSRIRLFEQDNQGLIASLNRGLELAHGKYVARMDADDIARPDRLEVALRHLEATPDVDILGTGTYCFGNECSGFIWLPADCTHEEIRAQLLFRNCIAHSTVILRRQRFDEVKLRYASGYIHGEDYELWERASRTLKLANITAVTMEHRLHPESVTCKGRSQMRATSRRVRQRVLEQLGFELSPFQQTMHEAISESGAEEGQSVDVAAAPRWLRLLEKRNAAAAVYPRAVLRNVLCRELLRLVDWPHGHNLRGAFEVFRSDFFTPTLWSMKSCLRLLAKSCWRRSRATQRHLS